jgi:hypothetical protein
MPSQRGQQCHRDNGKVRHVIKIVVVVIAHHAIAIIIDNSKTPVYRCQQQCHHDDGEDACALMAMTVLRHRNCH